MTRATSREHAGLPAPYRSPWSSLGEALQAVGADMVFRLRRHWRPLVAGSALALILALALLWARQGRQEPAQSLATDPTEQLQQDAPRRAEPVPAALSPSALPVSPALLGSPAVTELQAVTESQAVPAPQAVPEPPTDPLVALLQLQGVAGFVQSAEPDQARGCLRFRLLPPGARLPAKELERQFQRWMQLAMELGYDHLELLDPSGQLVARDALVGAGMIMFDAPPDA